MLAPASKANRFHYNPELKERARELRNHPTKAEKRLWYEVLARRKLGYAFLRQRPVLSYIADFMCKDLLLIIEVDGLSHDMDGAFQRDQIRQQRLEAVGFQVVRFRNEQVMEELTYVCFGLEQLVLARNEELRNW